jgi:hypothetical protein
MHRNGMIIYIATPDPYVTNFETRNAITNFETRNAIGCFETRMF